MLHIPRTVLRAPEKVSSIPVYLQGWLTAVAERHTNTRRVTVVENDEIVGSLSLVIERNGVGMKQAYNLPWARLCGLWFRQEATELRRAEIARQLIKRLPADVSYFLTVATVFDYNIFLSQGFQPALEENYIITPDLFPTLTNSFSSLTKRHLKQAQRELIVSTSTAEAFIGIYKANLSDRRRKPYAPLEIAHGILQEGLLRGQARISTVVRRDTGEIDAAVACLWDDARYYYWMTTRRQQQSGQTMPHQGAVKLLLWSAIQDAKAKNLIFDFDGAPTVGAARLYEGMGGRKTVRYRIARKTNFERYIGHIRKPLKTLLRKTLGRLMTLKMNY
jgi:hypothetical protein